MFNRSTNILIVDDMSIVRKLLRKCLEFHGFHNVEEARDGATGWQIIDSATQPFGLVICDWEMPVSSGLDLLKRFRSRPGLVDCPFVVLLGETETAAVGPAIKSGANGILIKPFTNDSILNCLKSTHKKIVGAA